MAESKLKTVKNQILIQEYLELKRITSENSSLGQKNEYLVNEIASLEIKLAEIQAKLNAQESELKKLSSKFPNDIDSQIKILEIENARLKESMKVQQNEIWKNEISQNLQFKGIYETSFKEILEKFCVKGQDLNTSLKNPLETEKNKLLMQLKKQEILLQEAVNDRNYIKNEVLPVLEHTLHLYEKNKLDLDTEIESLESKLKIPCTKKQENIIYEEDEFETQVRKSRDSSPIISPKQSLQYSFISSSKISAKPTVSKISLASPRNKFLPSQIKSKRLVKASK